MKLEIFSPNDFGGEHGLCDHCMCDGAKMANARLNEWLSKNGKPVYACLSRTWFETIDQCQGHASHKAWLICEKIIEKCSHPVEKIKCLILHPYTFECECGKKVQASSFEEIK